VSDEPTAEAAERTCRHDELPDTLWKRLAAAERKVEAVQKVLDTYTVPIITTGVSIVAADRIRAALRGDA
jgi:hypothetical protein